MNKKWTIIIFAAIFILANVATFLFAQGKIRIIEKIVTIYKDSVDKDNSAPVNSAAAKLEGDGKAKETAKTALRDFNDTDYFGNDESLTDSAVEAGALIQETDAAKSAEVEPAADSPKSSGVIKADGEEPNIAEEGTANPIPSVPEQPPRFADESIPMPQLPLFDTDFESGVDTGGNANISLPQLPDISEVMDDEYAEG